MEKRGYAAIAAMMISCGVVPGVLAAPSSDPAADPSTDPSTGPSTVEAARVEADPADVGSVDAIMTAVYDVISGAAGEPRDWDRMRSLFHEDARLVSMGANGARVMSLEDYIASATAAFSERGFYESEIARRQDRFGSIVHVLSTYAATREQGGEPFLRGVNSFQLIEEDGRWRVLTILWQAESEDLPLPAEYLPQ